MKDKNNLEQYFASLYFICTVILTIGYGNISANTNTERVFCICFMFFGISFYGKFNFNIIVKKDSLWDL